MQKTDKELLIERIRRNYADFRSETLVLGEEAIYNMARVISAIEDTYCQLTEFDYLEDHQAEYLLEFDNPLGMVADCLKDMRDGELVEIDEALIELFDQESHEENYITAKFAEELRQKHGSGISISVALLLEAIEAGERYMELRNLNKDKGAGYCLCEE